MIIVVGWYACVYLKTGIFMGFLRTRFLNFLAVGGRVLVNAKIVRDR